MFGNCWGNVGGDVCRVCGQNCLWMSGAKQIYNSWIVKPYNTNRSLQPYNLSLKQILIRPFEGADLFVFPLPYQQLKIRWRRTAGKRNRDSKNPRRNNTCSETFQDFPRKPYKSTGKSRNPPSRPEKHNFLSYVSTVSSGSSRKPQTTVNRQRPLGASQSRCQPPFCDNDGKTFGNPGPRYYLNNPKPLTPCITSFKRHFIRPLLPFQGPLKAPITRLSFSQAFGTSWGRSQLLLEKLCSWNLLESLLAALEKQIHPQSSTIKHWLEKIRSFRCCCSKNLRVFTKYFYGFSMLLLWKEAYPTSLIEVSYARLWVYPGRK